jgi:hypothetical protein
MPFILPVPPVICQLFCPVLDNSLKLWEVLEYAINARQAAGYRRIRQNKLDVGFAEIRGNDGRVDPHQKIHEHSLRLAAKVVSKASSIPTFLYVPQKLSRSL